MSYIVKGGQTVGTPREAHKQLYDNSVSKLDAGTVGTAIDKLNTNKQEKTDNSLTTTSKEIVGAVNELNSNFEELQRHTFGDIVTLEKDKNYITQTDGYFYTFIKLTGAGGNKFVSMIINDVSVINNVVQPNEWNRQSIYVKKGMSIKYTVGQGITDHSAVFGHFYPITR